MLRHSKIPLSLSLLVLCACSQKEDSETDDGAPVITTWTTGWSADQSAIFAFRGDSFAYLASEAHSNAIDVNSDGDQVDTFPVAVDTSTQTETLISVPARGLVWVGEYLYLDVYEEDGDLDWDLDTLFDARVLMYWTEGMSDPAYLLTLDADAEDALLSTGELGVCVPDGATSLEILSATDPAALEPVNLGLNGAASLELLALREGLLFVGVNENTAGVDENGDGDTTDERVLGLLDLTGADEFGQYSLVSVSLAISPGETPLFAEAEGDHEWLVAFLVDEFWQVNVAGTSLNSFAEVGTTFSPCGGLEDDDLEDEVLHFSLFSDLRAGFETPKNTGLVGSERIIRAGDFLGTVSIEGDEAGCDLNGDTDPDDRVFRWVRADRNNMAHMNIKSRLHALGDIGGPAGEIAGMGERFVIVVNEGLDGRDHDGHGVEDRDLIAWLEPAAETAWNFHHDDTPFTDENGEGLGDADLNGIHNFGWVVPTWLGEQSGTSRVGIAFSEESNEYPKDINGDGDTADSVPTFAYYDPTTELMEFPGFAVALDPENAGISILGSWAYYRVSEAEDDWDLNGNGSESDYLLWASNLTTAQTVNVSYLNGIVGTSIWSDPIHASCAAFLVDEGGFAGDINSDGSTSGFAVRYVRF